MSVGIQQSWQGLNNQAAQLALDMTNNAAAVLKLQAYLVAEGTSGLVALGDTSGGTDAQTLINLVDYMATVAQVFQGTATQGSQFNFANALVALTGPRTS